MLRIAILTAFPRMFEGPFAEGMIRIAHETGALATHLVDYRDFTTDRHRSIDDAPFGGGAGMILKPEPVAAAVEAAEAMLGGRAARILLGPAGEPLTQPLARELAGGERLLLLTGRYKDVDDRVRGDIEREVSIGDYVLSGGELPAMVLVDAVARLLPGVVGDEASVTSDSFETGLLDAPYYTRPARFRGREVPEVLRSGNHADIARWRRREALKRTLLWRPDLLDGASLTGDDLQLLMDIAADLTDRIHRVVDRGEHGEHPSN